MIAEEKLREKNLKYLALQAQIKEHDYTEEINERLEKYKSELISEYEEKRAQELGKVGAYLECITELLSELGETKSDEDNEEDSISEEENN